MFGLEIGMLKTDPMDVTAMAFDVFADTSLECTGLSIASAHVLLRDSVLESEMAK